MANRHRARWPRKESRLRPELRRRRPRCSDAGVHAPPAIDNETEDDCEAPEITGIAQIEALPRAPVQRLRSSQTRRSGQRPLWTAKRRFCHEPSYIRASGVPATALSVGTGVPPGHQRRGRTVSGGGEVVDGVPVGAQGASGGSTLALSGRPMSSVAADVRARRPCGSGAAPPNIWAPSADDRRAATNLSEGVSVSARTVGHTMGWEGVPSFWILVLMVATMSPPARSVRPWRSVRPRRDARCGHLSSIR
jgi:hypothetical protein